MRAFITMFRVASGDPWPESLTLVLEDGELNFKACTYMCSFIVIVCWISLEVRWLHCSGAASDAPRARACVRDRKRAMMRVRACGVRVRVRGECVHACESACACARARTHCKRRRG